MPTFPGELEPVDPQMLHDVLRAYLPNEDRLGVYAMLKKKQDETVERSMHAGILLNKKDEFHGRTVKYGFIQGVLTDAGRNLAGDSSHDIVLVINGQLLYVGSTHTVTVLPKES